jgi:hypothetical protein
VPRLKARKPASAAAGREPHGISDLAGRQIELPQANKALDRPQLSIFDALRQRRAPLRLPRPPHLRISHQRILAGTYAEENFWSVLLFDGKGGCKRIGTFTRRRAANAVALRLADQLHVPVKGGN